MIHAEKETRMKRFLIIAIMLLGVIALFQGCRRSGGSSAGTGIQVKGSDTMVNLGQAWAEEYMKKNPDANVSVTGGGSGTGIAALINGNADIIQSSREMTSEELDAARKRGMDPQEFEVARDGLSVIVNPANSVNRLTIAQLSDIYTRKITNWRQLGGRGTEIVVLSRDKSSGTHVFFLEHVLRRGNAKGPEEFANTVLMLPSSQAIADEVASNSDAIGYVGMGYVQAERHKTVNVAKDANSTYVEPTPANVLNNTYPIARPLYVYTTNKPAGAVKAFIDFVLSDEGQKIVQQQEFVPIRTIK